MRMWVKARSAIREDETSERGAVMLAFALSAILILGVVAIVVDVGVLQQRRHWLNNTLDAGVLAGATMLPGNSGRYCAKIQS